jgi:hypothetical protein
MVHSYNLWSSKLNFARTFLNLRVIRRVQFYHDTRHVNEILQIYLSLLEIKKSSIWLSFKLINRRNSYATDNLNSSVLISRKTKLLSQQPESAKHFTLCNLSDSCSVGDRELLGPETVVFFLPEALVAPAVQSRSSASEPSPRATFFSKMTTKMMTHPATNSEILASCCRSK